MSAPEPEGRTDPASDRLPSGNAASIPVPDNPNAAPAKQLTPEEQMAAFEKDLKENDWGHQPC